MLLSQDASGCVAFCCPPLQPAQADGRNFFFDSSDTRARMAERKSWPQCRNVFRRVHWAVSFFDFHRFGWMLMHPALMLLKAALYVALSIFNFHFLPRGLAVIETG